ncbi:MAG: HPF/RaiA family ribosome-associated protein [Candidatus Rokubacteria bacterium]|nr:HPF/RaiA family ribosome-associated protein [Candidatus Rokubacteria bacterium]
MTDTRAEAHTVIEIAGLGDERAGARIRKRMAEALRTLGVSPVTAHVAFVDDNGPKGGGIRCALTVRVPYRRSLRVDRSAMTARLAFDAGFEALERQLERYHERWRDARRRPKKYYVAKRLLAAGGGAPPPETRRATHG